MEMNKALLLADLSALLEMNVAELVDDYQLMDCQLWDSLSMVSMVGSIDSHYGVAIRGHELEECKTVADLFSLVAEKLNNTSNNVVALR